MLRLITRLLGPARRWRRRTLWQVSPETCRRLEEERRNAT